MSIYIYIYNTHHIMYVGVLGIIFSYPFQERKWLVFDGPVDAVWHFGILAFRAYLTSFRGDVRIEPNGSAPRAPRASRIFEQILRDPSRGLQGGFRL